MSQGKTGGPPKEHKITIGLSGNRLTYTDEHGKDATSLETRPQDRVCWKVGDSDQRWAVEFRNESPFNDKKASGKGTDCNPRTVRSQGKPEKKFKYFVALCTETGLYTDDPEIIVKED